MKMTRRAAQACALALLIASGCSPSDERLVELAERSAQRQKEQNETIARQSKAVTEQNQRVAEAAKELVAKDAESRQEMVRAQRELHSQLQAERSSIDRQRAEMERERSEIAQRRGRDPIVAEAIRGIGVLLVCLVPLIVAVYAVSRLDRGQPESEALGELLVHELVRDDPVLLPSRTAAALENHHADSPEEASGRPADQVGPMSQFPSPLFF